MLYRNFIVPVSVEKNINYKGLRQAGSIIPEENFKTGECLRIPDFNGGFSTGKVGK